MPRGVKPQPTHLKIVKGNPGRRPLNTQEPKPQNQLDLANPPAFLAPDAVAEWNARGKELTACGILTSIDHAVFAIYCQTYARWLEAERALQASGTLTVKLRRGGAHGETINPLLKIAEKAAIDLIRAAGEFGMTPSTRSRIKAEQILRDPGQAAAAAKYF